VLDVRFPATAPTGLELQRTLVLSGILTPIIFISGHADVRISVEAMKHGAIEFLPKPFREQEILDAIRHGIERDRARLERDDVLRGFRSRIGELTAREHDIMLLTAQGLLVKQVAAKLQLSEVTVKVHRARLMKKLQVRSLVELVRLVDSVDRAEHDARQFGPHLS
jgi:FixJ family two-component response regulator